MSSNLFGSKKFKRVEMSHDEKISRAAQLQIFTLDRIAGLTQGRDVVFHGGTSIAMMHSSPRWSEDLDFMAAPGAIAGLFGQLERFQRAIELDCSIEMPGSTIGMRIKGPEKGEIGKVSRIDLRWEHPMTFGVIKIKLEFYGCEAEALERYKSTPRLARLEGHAARNPIPSADIDSIWGDKVLAMAQRPTLKHRDQHDLGFIADKLGDDADLAAALAASRDIYRLDNTSIVSGLARDVVRRAIDDRASFDMDMQRWFGRDEFSRMTREGYLDQVFSEFHAQFVKAEVLAKDLCADKGCSSLDM